MGEAVLQKAVPLAVSQPPRYCSCHDTSEKRMKAHTAHPQRCRVCNSTYVTSYAEFTLCAPCSERLHQCMICGAAAPVSGIYVPSSAARGEWSPPAMPSHRATILRLQREATDPLPMVRGLGGFGIAKSTPPFVSPPARTAQPAHRASLPAQGSSLPVSPVAVSWRCQSPGQGSPLETHDPRAIVSQQISRSQFVVQPQQGQDQVVERGPLYGESPASRQMKSSRLEDHDESFIGFIREMFK